MVEKKKNLDKTGIRGSNPTKEEDGSWQGSNTSFLTNCLAESFFESPNYRTNIKAQQIYEVDRKNSRNGNLPQNGVLEKLLLESGKLSQCSFSSIDLIYGKKLTNLCRGIHTQLTENAIEYPIHYKLEDRPKEHKSPSYKNSRHQDIENGNKKPPMQECRPRGTNNNKNKNHKPPVNTKSSIGRAKYPLKKVNNDNKNYNAGNNCKTEVSGRITTCRILQGIWDDTELPWSNNAYLDKPNLLSNFQFNNPEGIADNLNLKRGNDSSVNKNYIATNSVPQNDKSTGGRRIEASPDGGFECANCNKIHEKEFDGVVLGPKFFSKICNLWPDLIARLALDINLDPSPDHDSEPPDSPNVNIERGVISTNWSTHPGLNNNPLETVFPHKRGAPEDSSCPKLPLENATPDGFTNINALSSTNALPELQPHYRSPRSKKAAFEAFPTKNLSDKKASNENLNDNDSPRTRHASIEVIDNRPNCQSPICGSPRPKAPIPKIDIAESELHSLDSCLGDDEMITSYIDRDYDEEEADENEEEEEEGAEENEEEGRTPLRGEEDREFPLKEAFKHRSSERTRRRLPEIPKNKKSYSSASILALRTPTLAEEIQEAESGVGSRSSTPEGFSILSSNNRPILVLKCHSYLRDDSCSPESELRLQVQDIDSGHSTQHSPDGAKSMSPQMCQGRSPLSVGVPSSHIELLDATHRGLYRFIPRHEDELEIEIGDPVYVQKEADDLWCEGVNLRNGKQGIFPAAHVTDVDYSDFDPTVPKVKKERYLLNYLGSIETLCHKGNEVLCQAVRKIARENVGHAFKSNSCILEISDQGIRMVDKSPPGSNHAPCHDYFYHLKHVSFCGFHPKDPRYFGFITKHPAVQRFACHVFESLDSTRPVAEAVGRAFQRFYKQFIETAFPTEDIYIE